MNFTQKQVYQNALDIYIKQLDAKEKCKEIVLSLNSKGIKIPDEYKHIDVLEPHWRKQRGIMKRLKQAARTVAKNYIKRKG